MNFTRKNDTMVVVGFAPNSRKQSPWNNPNVDLFGINEGHSFKWWKQLASNTKGWFQLHARESFMRPGNHNSQGHAKWLTQKHPFPIILQEIQPDIPSSMAFPLQESIKQFGTYYRSTLAYVVTFALLAGYKKLEIYGFEMGSDSEYWGQRANACYLIGKARGMGLEVYVPPTSGILTGIRYAYSNNFVGARQDLEVNISKAQNNRALAEGQAQSLQGEYNILKEHAIKYPELAKLRDETAILLRKKDNEIHLCIGRIQGLVLAVKTFDVFSIIDSGSA